MLNKFKFKLSEDLVNIDAASPEELEIIFTAVRLRDDEGEFFCIIWREEGEVVTTEYDSETVSKHLADGTWLMLAETETEGE